MFREMQCEIRAMSDLREGGRSSRVSDTLPKRGRVNEVCKEWLVHEDGALAYQLQQKEVAALWIVKRLENTLCQELHKLRVALEHLLAFMQEYYTGNRSRNAIVREDFPKARDEQKREEEEAVAKYHQLIQQQEEKDAELAKDLAQRIQRDEEIHRKLLEAQDKTVASQIQEKEIKKVREAKICHLSPLQGAVPVGDVNSVGLPLPTEIQHISHQLRNVNINKDEQPVFLDLDQEEHQRLLQEQKDEELARRLQEQEEALNSYDMLDRDRQLAIEAQDKELAKLLQERERAKAKRARERARQRALLKKQLQQQEQQQPQQEDIETELDSTFESSRDHRITRPTSLDINRPHKPRLPDPEEIEVLGPITALPNIAMAIDPTYTPSCSSSSTSSPAVCLPPPPIDLESEDTSPVPPYMPIQGQRRTASLEKKQKKNKVKDGCKQQ
ncbi:uncharacterized protein LOC142318978 isoform X2 [Lycorma delicatula]|uniref:uncharacterized protein LOC142318978 isoform X2 n=1 Tax=Lycorma delicatula TaxID=130591 RepID=UPI003F512799